MRVLFLTSGENVPSTRYRILPYLPRLRAHGIECEIAHSRPAKYQRWPVLGWRLSHLARRTIRWADWIIARSKAYDCIVIEREIFDDPTSNLEAAFRRITKRLVLDVDDGIFLRYPEKFAQIASRCDHLIAGNKLLAEECRRHCSSVSIIPTAIDLDEYAWPRERITSDCPVIGWIGTPSNLKYLDPIWPVLEELRQQTNFTFRIVTSDGQDLRKVLSKATFPIEFQPWTSVNAVREIQKFDIGIMPLPDEPWERYKCGFKLLQYMAAGTPAIASPVGVNQQIIRNGDNGYLAETQLDWKRDLTQLLQNPEQTIEASYSVDGQVEKLIAALKG